MLELQAIFVRTNGTKQQVTLRIHDVRQTHPDTDNSWSAAVDLVGFDEMESVRIRGRDFCEAIEDAARFAAIRACDKAEAAGGGTFDPPLWPRAKN